MARSTKSGRKANPSLLSMFLFGAPTTPYLGRTSNGQLALIAPKVCSNAIHFSDGHQGIVHDCVAEFRIAEKPLIQNKRPNKSGYAKMLPETSTPPAKESNGEQATKQVVSEPTTNAEWTSTEDDALIKMKKEQKSWVDIEKSLMGKGKDRGALKARFLDLFEEGKAVLASVEEGSKSSSEKSLKSILVNKETSESSSEDTSDGEDDTDEEAEPKQLRGRPVIWMKPDDPIDVNQVYFLDMLIIKCVVLIGLETARLAPCRSMQIRTPQMAPSRLQAVRQGGHSR